MSEIGSLTRKRMENLTDRLAACDPSDPAPCTAAELMTLMEAILHQAKQIVDLKTDVEWHRNGRVNERSQKEGAEAQARKHLDTMNEIASVVGVPIGGQLSETLAKAKGLVARTAEVAKAASKLLDGECECADDHECPSCALRVALANLEDHNQPAVLTQPANEGEPNG